MHRSFSVWYLEGKEEYQEGDDGVETVQLGHSSLPVPDVFGTEIFVGIKKTKSRNDLLSPGKILRSAELCFCVCVCVCVCAPVCACVTGDPSSASDQMLPEAGASSDLKRLVPNCRT